MYQFVKFTFFIFFNFLILKIKVTCQTNREYFQFSLPIYNFELLFNLVPLFFKMIQFYPLQFGTKLTIKLNYNLYIHVKIIFYHLYIKSLPKYSYYFTFHIFSIVIFYT